MSTTSVNLLKERVLRAASACVEELEGKDIIHTKATRDLVRAVKALEQETWRLDEAPSIVRDLRDYIRATPEGHPGNVRQRGELLRSADAFLGERKVEDDTNPAPRVRRPLRKLGR